MISLPFSCPSSMPKLLCPLSLSTAVLPDPQLTSRTSSSPQLACSCTTFNAAAPSPLILLVFYNHDFTPTSVTDILCLSLASLPESWFLIASFIKWSFKRLMTFQNRSSVIVFLSTVYSDMSKCVFITCLPDMLFTLCLLQLLSFMLLFPAMSFPPILHLTNTHSSLINQLGYELHKTFHGSHPKLGRFSTYIFPQIPPCYNCLSTCLTHNELFGLRSIFILLATFPVLKMVPGIK